MNPLEDFRIRVGSIIGSEHQRLQMNNQDGYATGHLKIEDESYRWGILCDGCSAGPHNEVGAILLSNYLCREIHFFLSSGSHVQEIPGKLFIAGLGFLRLLASQTAQGDVKERLIFVRDHLLCTVVGFVMDSEKCVIFNSGDGVIVVNDSVERIHQDNKPLYMGYHLLHKDMLAGTDTLPLEFTTRVFDVNELQRFAICSDGILEDVIEDVWNHEHSLGLVRKLRVLRMVEGVIFSDDCTVIAVERTESSEREVNDDN